MSDYYSFKNIDKTNSIYRVIVGQRSNGKTYGFCEKVLTEFFKSNRPSAYIRRWAEDIKARNIEQLFSPHTEKIKKLSKNKYNSFVFRSGCWYLCSRDDNGDVKYKDNNFFCKSFALNNWEHSKGADSGNFKFICFDEFISRRGYLSNEFTHFQNLLSSIIRQKDDCIIYMIANTVSKECLYFKEMRIDVNKIKQGEIFVYKNGDENAFISIEYCETAENLKKKTVKYYDFENSVTGKMITDGVWEIPDYPHLFFDFTEKDVILSAFIEYGYDLNVKVLTTPYDEVTLFIYPATKKTDKKTDVLVYTENPVRPLERKNIYSNDNKAFSLITKLIKENRISFSDNDTGDKFFNFIAERG